MSDMYNFLKNKSVLYIEDELDVLKNISTILRSFFDKFYIAADGESGYQLFLEKEVDMLLVDIELPKMNGIELIKKVRKTNQTIPIIVISAYTKTDYLLESIELNIDKYIVKPLTSKKIHQLLSRLNEDFSSDEALVLSPGVFLDSAVSEVSFANTQFTLTKKELGFLSILAHKKTIFYEDVFSLWGDDVPSQNAVRSFIKNLRKKLPDNYLRNRSGIGYFIESCL